MKLKPAQGVAQAHRYDGLQGANFSQATLHYVLAEHHHTLRADILPRISWPVILKCRYLVRRLIENEAEAGTRCSASPSVRRVARG